MTKRLATGVWVACTSMRVQSRALRGSPFVVLLGAVQPIVLLLITIGSAANRETGATARVMVGVMLTALWGATIWTSGNVLRVERWQGTLGALVTGVRPPWLILLGKSLGATAHTVAVILASGVATVAVLRMPLRIAHPFLLAGGILVVVAAGSALGMLLSCLFLLTRHGPEWSSALMFPVFVFGDMLIPGELLPSPLRWLAMLIPMSWARKFLTGVITGELRPGALGVLIVLTVGYFSLAVWAFSRIIEVARDRGSLDLA
jgi:ABC-2 type transport system permease protein